MKVPKNSVKQIFSEIVNLVIEIYIEGIVILCFHLHFTGIINRRQAGFTIKQ